MADKAHGIAVDRNTDSMTATFKLVDKKAEKVIQQLTLAWDDTHEKVRDFLKLYGLTKFCQDRKSQSDVMNKLDDYQEVFDMLAQGVLTQDRKSSGPTIKLEVEALANLRKTSVKHVQTLLKKYSKEEREEIFANDAVQKEVEKLKKKLAAQEASDDSFDDLLSK